MVSVRDAPPTGAETGMVSASTGTSTPRRAEWLIHMKAVRAGTS